jgi:predicted Zn-dependent peptidase
MIHFQKHILSNGLRLIIHEDHTLPVAVLNVLYDVGSRDEDPERTGFAHLFEHLMFGGSIHIPSYDEPLQRVGGENNAFTSNDLTNYYIQIPSVNIETAFWLESDRMLNLAFSQKSLEVQRNVVVEEFKQRYLNQPYGDAWLRLRPLVYKEHPYRWATIGKDISHIENVQMEHVKAFFKKHYNPSNAILVVSGDIEPEKILALSEKWFGPIPSGVSYKRHLPIEPVQMESRKEEVHTSVPLDSIYMAFPMMGKSDPKFYAVDLLSDILGKGSSSRLYQNLVKKKPVFAEIHSFLSSDLDPGMFVIEGKPVKGVSLEEAEAEIWLELEKLKNQYLEEKELTKVKNKLESTLVYGQMNLLDKSINLAYFELLGNAGLINSELDQYLKVGTEDIQKLAQSIFLPQRENTLLYFAQ